MWLKRISILNYKNIEQAELSFSPKMNCIIGRNGMGKTNLMDAVYYLSFCKSATNPIDTQNIFHDRDFLWYKASIRLTTVSRKKYIADSNESRKTVQAQ